MDEMFAGYVLTTGALRRRDLAYLLGVETAPAKAGRPHSRVFIYSGGQWIPPVDLDWIARSCTVCRDAAERLMAISEQGYVLALGGGQVVVEPRIAPGNETPGPLTDIRAIAGPAYAVGTLRQAYIREAPGRWRRIDQTCRATGPGAADFAFRSIDGFSQTEIYAAGWEGEVWHYDGQRWSPRETPTNLAFYCIRCAGNGQVYAVGQRGLLLRGRGDIWEIVFHEATEDDFWGCEWFRDRLYVATMRVLYELHGDHLVPVDFGEALPPSTCYQLSAADGVMWSIGENAVMEFNGTNWTLIL